MQEDQGILRPAELDRRRVLSCNPLPRAPLRADIPNPRLHSDKSRFPHRDIAPFPRPRESRPVRIRAFHSPAGPRGHILCGCIRPASSPRGWGRHFRTPTRRQPCGARQTRGGERSPGADSTETSARPPGRMLGARVQRIQLRLVPAAADAVQDNTPAAAGGWPEIPAGAGKA
ncbi:hypothetical protein C8R44DRAFT_798452 [Mycena epipterygia]|nr:hypothetical protein C8R44DRAFT_798452 [Mycena epipterygia]